jgi:outer membrane lipoprotein carrier protein
MLKETIMALATLLGGGLAKAPDQQPAAKAAATVASAQRLDAAAVVKRVQKFYDGTDRLTAKFRQYYTNQAFNQTSTSNGRLYVKKPGMMRWDYFRKYRGKVSTEKSLLSDGKMLWVVEHDNKQVFKKDLTNTVLPVAITFLYGKGDLARDFDAALTTAGKYGKTTDYVLELKPKKPSAQYKTLWLVVDPDNFRVRESIVLEESGNTNHFKFYEPDLERQVKPTLFAFDASAVKGYRIHEEPADATQTP